MRLSKFGIISAFILALFVVVGGSSHAQGYNILSRSQWGADDSLVSDIKPTYAQVKNVVIEDVTTQDDTISLSTKTYVGGLYYYLAADNAMDLPFSYLVGWDGSIYEGANGGLGVVTQKDGQGDLVVGYLDNGTGITTQATNAIGYLLNNLNKQTGVGLSNVNAADYLYANTTFSLGSPDGAWNGLVSSLKTNLKGIVPATSNYPTYSIGINGVNTSEGNTGEDVVSVTFTNTSTVPLYGNIYAGSDKNSPLYLANVWTSQERSNATNLSDLEPNQTGIVNFDILASAKAGSYTLNLYTDSGKINNATVNITLPISTTSTITPTPSVTVSPTTTTTVTTTPTPTVSATPTPSTVTSPTPTPIKTVKIGNTGLGYLNVHASPSVGAKVIGTVKTGQSFAVYQESSGGFYEILYDGTHDGWIDSVYTTS
jgi:hypothetical protein